MKSILKTISLGACAVALFVACSSANFGSGSSSKSADSNNGGANATGSGGTDGGNPGASAPGAGGPGSSSAGGPAQCTQDKVSLGWTGDEKDCIDKGQTWNFDKKQCMQIRKATFDCTWANMLGALNVHAIGTPLITADAAAGAKLISCGQSQDGNRLVAQWISVKDGATDVPCAGGAPDQYHVTTGCYTYYPNGGAPAPAVTQADKDALVFSCLSAL